MVPLLSKKARVFMLARVRLEGVPPLIPLFTIVGRMRDERAVGARIDLGSRAQGQSVYKAHSCYNCKG